jgi:DNA-binding NtrC family response regulator
MHSENKTVFNVSELSSTEDKIGRNGVQFITRNPSSLEMLSRVRLVANSSASVLLAGESGTGKDVIARLIHQEGERSKKPFIAINCAALPKDVVDNELFGHEREAFTGAVSKKSGCFENAQDGTLFLDEIAEMHPQTQAKLLRAIENRSFRRLGGKEEVKVEARVVAATNKDISASLRNGSLREDLFYRLSVVEFDILPLRHRKEDIPPLLNHFIEQLTNGSRQIRKEFSSEAVEMLMNFDWPGNVRELRNLVERMLLVCPDEIISARYLPEKITKLRSAGDSVMVPIGTSLLESENILIGRTLKYVDNNKSEAARILGISRRTLHSKLKKGGR